MRRLLFLASAVVFLDVAFYAAIAPLLPDYADEFGLSKAGAGILSAAYAAGTLVGSFPAALIASHSGPRRTVVGGLLLMGVSSAVFGFGEEVALLDAARFVQGVAGALIWVGAFTWLITTAPDDRRGAVIGTALGAAVGGALLGPALGAAAAEIGTGPVFSSVLVVASSLAVFASRLPEVRARQAQGAREVIATVLSRPVLVATGLVLAPSLMFGGIDVLVPLRIAELGGAHGAIAGGFIAGAALEASLSPVAGRYSDRRGRRAPFTLGLAICAVAMSAIAVAAALGVVLVALVVASLGAGLCFAPALTMLSEAAESTGLHQGFAGGLSNAAWAGGQVVGGAAGGAVANVTGNAVPCFAIVFFLLVAVAYAHRTLAPSPPVPSPVAE